MKLHTWECNMISEFWRVFLPGMIAGAVVMLVYMTLKQKAK